MGLRERVLLPFGRNQRIVFALFFGTVLLGNIGLELYLMRSYTFNVIHLSVAVVFILTLMNPKGIRALIFGFFIYFLMKMGQIPVYSVSYLPNINFDHMLLKFVVFFLTSSMKTMVYAHVALYAFFAYYSMKRPRKPKLKSTKEILDQK